MQPKMENPCRGHKGPPPPPGLLPANMIPCVPILCDRALKTADVCSQTAKRGQAYNTKQNRTEGGAAVSKWQAVRTTSDSC